MTVHLPRLWRIMSTVSENHPGILRYGVTDRLFGSFSLGVHTIFPKIEK